MSSSPEVNRVMAALRNGVDISVETLALDIHGALVRHTPVDTGFARSRWMITDDEAGGGMSARVGHGARGRVSSGLVAVKRVRTTSKRARFTPVSGAQVRRKTARGVDIRIAPKFVVNDAPYIGRLNDGHSKQAPRGFVQLAIMEGIKVADIKLGNLDRLV